MRISDWSSDVCSSDLFRSTIGKEYASRLLRHDIFKAGGSRKDCHLCARTNKIAEDVTLGAIVNGDDMGAFIACFIQAISKPEPPHAIFPQARFLARHFDGKIHALKARPALRLGEKRIVVEQNGRAPGREKGGQ